MPWRSRSYASESAQGGEIPPRDELTAEALGALPKADIEIWWRIIKAGIKAE
jgi:hypothetical protein